ncbi:MAG: alpha/beta hydrolase [Verrucomicrobiota bacterium]|nr:alpha/beta hydrolase [Verrucomicrobiota bacterium]
MSDLNFIHRFVPGKESSRALLLLHGTGADENDLIDLGQALDPKAALLSPRGKVLENGRPRFFRRLAEGVFDEEDVIAQAHELAQFVDDAAKRYEIDTGNLVAVGYSNGANIGAAMLLLGLAKFSQAILFRVMVPLSKIDPPSLKTLFVFISAGQFDPIARLPITQRLAQLFESAGAEVTLQFQPSGHELTETDVVDARKWLSR